ncbi:MAG: hypothetical protein WC444_05730 [Candidatus Paceibacterota bacterium]
MTTTIGSMVREFMDKAEYKGIDEDINDSFVLSIVYSVIKDSVINETRKETLITMIESIVKEIHDKEIKE